MFGYQVAGKTGTAYKFVNGQYDTSRRRTFFVGMAPAEKPRYLIAVMVDEPTKTGIAAVRRRRRYLAKLCGAALLFGAVPPSLSMPEPFNAAAVVARMGSHPTALSSDSRRIGKNCAFLAYPGDVFDGRGFIPDALSAGAVGIFWEAENFVWLSDWSVPNVAVPRLHLHVGDIADTVYHSPSEKLFTAAVTGTNGKTTVTHFAAQLCGVDKSAVIGTLGAGFLGRMQATDNTTPDAASIHALLSDFSAAGAKSAFIEASSHGIAQKRLAGISLNCAAFCNAGCDHTDYHGDLPSYWRAKAALLQTPDLQTAVLNADDDYCATLRDSSSAPDVLSYGFAGKELRFLSCAKDNDAWRVKVDGLCGAREFCFSFIGRHNVENFAAAALIAHVAGVNWDDG